MRILIVEDDEVSGSVMSIILGRYGSCDVVTDGNRAVAAFVSALDSGMGYTLVCLDIMLPGLDGQHVLKALRDEERRRNIGGLDGAKVLMMTALGDNKNIVSAFNEQCEGYLVKPIRKDKVAEQLRLLGFEPLVR